MSKTMIKEIEQKEKSDQMKVEFGNPKKLKTHLQSAMNTATSLVNYIPKITSELIVCINDYQKKQSEKITTCITLLSNDWVWAKYLCSR